MQNLSVCPDAKASPFGRGVTAGDGEGEPAKEIQENIITLSALLRYILRPAAGKLGAKRR